MRYFHTLSTIALAAGMALAGASILRAADWRQAGEYRQDYRTDYPTDYRDVRGRYAAVDRLRMELYRDQARLDEDIRCGRRWAVDRDYAAVNRDRRALEAMRRDFRYGRW